MLDKSSPIPLEELQAQVESALAEDIGSALGCGAYLSALRRTQSGCFIVEDSIPGDSLDDSLKAQWVRLQRIDVEQVQKLLQSF